MNKTIYINHVVLTTERLTLRTWKQSDLDDSFEYASIDGVGQMAGWNPHKTKEETQMILDSFINHKKTFALVNENKVIGSLGIEEYNEENYPEYKELYGRSISYVLSKDYWGKGFMPEAVHAVIDYLFNDVKLDFNSSTLKLANNVNNPIFTGIGLDEMNRLKNISFYKLGFHCQNN